MKADHLPPNRFLPAFPILVNGNSILRIAQASNCHLILASAVLPHNLSTLPLHTADSTCETSPGPNYPHCCCSGPNPVISLLGLLRPASSLASLLLSSFPVQTGLRSAARISPQTLHFLQGKANGLTLTRRGLHDVTPPSRSLLHISLLPTPLQLYGPVC